MTTITVYNIYQLPYDILEYIAQFCLAKCHVKAVHQNYKMLIDMSIYTRIYMSRNIRIWKSNINKIEINWYYEDNSFTKSWNNINKFIS